MLRGREMDMARLLSDHGIEHTVTDRGWVQLPCPLCYKGDGKFGLGWKGWGFTCFRCGKLPTWETLAKLVGIRMEAVPALLRRYEVDSTLPPERKAPVARGAVCAPPLGLAPLTDRCRAYLERRAYEPDELERRWGLQSTGIAGSLRFRLFIPVIQSGLFVAWQARDITERQRERYLSCPDEKAAVPIKECVYGLDEARAHGAETVVVTEGVTKVWRLGPPAVAVFGAGGLSARQVLALTKFKRVRILFDDDRAGQDGAELLVALLAPLVKSVGSVRLKGVRDVGDIRTDEARRLMRRLCD